MLSSGSPGGQRSTTDENNKGGIIIVGEISLIVEVLYLMLFIFR